MISLSRCCMKLFLLFIYKPPTPGWHFFFLKFIFQSHGLHLKQSFILQTVWLSVLGSYVWIWEFHVRKWDACLPMWCPSCYGRLPPGTWPPKEFWFWTSRWNQGARCPDWKEGSWASGQLLGIRKSCIPLLMLWLETAVQMGLQSLGSHWHQVDSCQEKQTPGLSVSSLLPWRLWPTLTPLLNSPAWNSEQHPSPNSTSKVVWNVLKMTSWCCFF